MREDSQHRPTHPPQMNPDFARILRASKLQIGTLRARGVPAILLGVAAIVATAGAVRSLAAVSPMLPETLREIKSVIEAARRDTRSLKA